jgi:hypothetical protein
MAMGGLLKYLLAPPFPTTLPPEGDRFRGSRPQGRWLMGVLQPPWIPLELRPWLKTSFSFENNFFPRLKPLLFFALFNLNYSLL